MMVATGPPERCEAWVSHRRVKQPAYPREHMYPSLGSVAETPKSHMDTAHADHESCRDIPAVQLYCDRRLDALVFVNINGFLGQKQHPLDYRRGHIKIDCQKTRRQG